MFRHFTGIILKQQFICLSCIIETNSTAYNPYAYVNKYVTYVINAVSTFPKWLLSHSFNNDNTQRVQRFSRLNTHFMLFFVLF